MFVKVSLFERHVRLGLGYSCRWYITHSLNSHAEIGLRSQCLLGILRMNLDYTSYLINRELYGKPQRMECPEFVSLEPESWHLEVVQRQPWWLKNVEAVDDVCPVIAVAGSSCALTVLQSDVRV